MSTENATQPETDQRLNLDHPQNQWDERLGYPVWIPETSPKLHITGIGMLNLINAPDEPASGDWHSYGWWWSPQLLNLDNERACVILSDTPAHDVVWESLGDAGINDIRVRLAMIGHPAASNTQPVCGANHARAVVENAWTSLPQGEPRPIRPETWQCHDWLIDEQCIEARQMAETLARTITDKARAKRWETWLRALTEADPQDAPWRRRPILPEYEPWAHDTRGYKVITRV